MHGPAAPSDALPSIGDVVELQQQGDVNALIGLLNDPTVSGKVAIRGAAARALGELQAGRAIAPLAQLLAADERTDVRAAAAIAIGAIGGTDGVPALTAGLEDHHDTVRIHAGNSLGKLGDPDAVPALLELLDDRGTTVRRVAARALGMIGSAEVLPRLLEVAASDRLVVRTAAVDAAGCIGGASAIDGLRQLRRQSRNPIFRRYVSVELKRLERATTAGGPT